MPKNNRPRTTVTRSVSFDSDVFQRLEIGRELTREDRSEFLRNVLEDTLGLRAHPELHGLGGKIEAVIKSRKAKK